MLSIMFTSYEKNSAIVITHKDLQNINKLYFNLLILLGFMLSYPSTFSMCTDCSPRVSDSLTYISTNTDSYISTPITKMETYMGFVLEF